MRRRELMLLLGAAVAAPAVLRAQQKAMPVLGFLGSGSRRPYAENLAAVRQGLSETGYVEGQDVAIEYRWAEGHPDRAPLLRPTSSARLSSAGGTVRPSAFAVLRLMTNSYLVGA